MGGKPKQVDPAQAQQSSAAADAAAQASANLSNVNAKEQQTLFNQFYGTNGHNGTLGQFMDPASLNVSRPTGAYGTQWNADQNQIAKDYANQRGQLAQSFANSGVGGRSSPSGFQADEMRKLSGNEADARGSTFAGLTNEQYKDALSNFWNTANVANSQAAGAREGALAGSANAGNTAANVYSTAGRQAQMPNTLGSVLGAAGTVGAGAAQGAAMCPAKGAKIRLANRTWADGMRDQVERTVEQLMPAMELDQLGGLVGKLESIRGFEQEVVTVHTLKGKRALVGRKHAFVLAAGGYVNAEDALNLVVRTVDGPDLVNRVTPAGRAVCYELKIGGNHTYAVDGIWSLD